MQKIQNSPQKNPFRNPLFFLLLPLLGIIITLTSTERAFAARSAHFIASDSITLENQKIRIEIRLEGETLPFMSRPISGERVRFLQGDKTLGISLTGGNGLATMALPPLPAGLHKIRVELPESTFQAEPKEILVGSWNPKEPFLVVMAPSLLLNRPPSSPPPFLTTPPIPAALPHAAELLTRAQKEYHLLFLTRDNPLSYNEQKKWLETFAFPEVPLIKIREGKRAILEQIQHWKKAGWNRFEWIITDSREEAESLLKEGLRPILLTNEKEKKKKAKTESPHPLEAEDWKAVGELIRQHSNSGK
jgi:hypothetical protein